MEVGLKLKFSANNPGRQFAASIEGAQMPIARAAKLAMTAAGKQAQAEGRRSIASAGFSRKWQKSLHFKVYPTRKASMSPAALVYSPIKYSGIFEHGGTIAGKPLLWLPLKSVPRPGGNPIPVGKYTKITGQKLVTIKGRGGLPLLGAQVIDRVQGNRIHKRTVPLYFGKKTTQMPRKFHIREAAERAADRLSEFYFRVFKDE
jgi:hypothetical protein